MRIERRTGRLARLALPDRPNVALRAFQAAHSPTAEMLTEKRTAAWRVLRTFCGTNRITLQPSWESSQTPISRKKL